MAITQRDVEKVALLARLELSPDELATMTAQMAQIVGYVVTAQELDWWFPFPLFILSLTLGSYLLVDAWVRHRPTPPGDTP